MFTCFFSRLGKGGGASHGRVHVIEPRQHRLVVRNSEAFRREAVHGIGAGGEAADRSAQYTGHGHPSRAFRS